MIDGPFSEVIDPDDDPAMDRRSPYRSCGCPCLSFLDLKQLAIKCPGMVLKQRIDRSVRSMQAQPFSHHQPDPAAAAERDLLPARAADTGKLLAVCLRELLIAALHEYRADQFERAQKIAAFHQHFHMYA